MTTYTRAEDISNALFARMQGISIAQGYETDIGVTAFKGRRYIDEPMVPCSSLIEGDDKVMDSAQGKSKLLQKYLLEGYAFCDPDHPNVVGHKILRDLKRAVFAEATGKPATLGGAVKEVVYLGRVIAPRADGTNIVMAAIEVGVEYAELHTQP